MQEQIPQVHEEGDHTPYVSEMQQLPNVEGVARQEQDEKKGEDVGKVEVLGRGRPYRWLMRGKQRKEDSV
ncbi:hypothetical protein GOP47_0022802 [Adiantum capillus-veneris]|uniref:Uncharacterized protein n=1 Tax=Adiantum capillus-veneris TaxID=13818 RepID=A0A9D4U6A1_ADICA|nr:hypothetical protein GOP47_0022802 [Adiantum capillus-veneris]